MSDTRVSAHEARQPSQKGREQRRTVASDERWERTARSLRDSEDSRFVALTMPRTLARLPYGKATKPIDEFGYEEVALGKKGESIAVPQGMWQYRNPGKLISQRQLLQQVWGQTYHTETGYLRQYLKHLRRKLEPDPTRPRHLVTEPGMGYRFQP